MAISGTRALAVVSELAAGQWGLLTTAQAEREGVTRLHLSRLTDAGVLERVDRGVYATAASPADHRHLRATWLTLDPARTAEERLADPVNAGVASHTSAASLHRLGDLLDDTPEFTIPHRKQSRREIRIHRRPLTDIDITIVDGLPTTTPERTIADLLRDGHDPDHVAHIIGQGVRRGVIDLDDLTVHLDPLARRHGHPSGQAFLEYLLDLVNLSPAALTRELASTPAVQQLVALGQSAAVGDLMASLMPQIDTAKMFRLNEINSARMASAFADVTQTKALHAAIVKATSPTFKTLQQWAKPDSGRLATPAIAFSSDKNEEPHDEQ